jgi:hypothetical protein
MLLCRPCNLARGKIFEPQKFGAKFGLHDAEVYDPHHGYLLLAIPRLRLRGLYVNLG